MLSAMLWKQRESQPEIASVERLVEELLENNHNPEVQEVAQSARRALKALGATLEELTS
jgi:hypothetical protein